ncbi:MAG: NAD(P)/FAD-dependent oxidoreductase [Symploca sp. SIO3C6]|uniref:NAD(P)/FAD-dependent oxidoreductase n=1 Tax=Symploca sp. SIO1C4 TaxID=2607765 RepID=A0A6B3NP96_9CYAN|nr:NAD(P)/FAD-dependent oxidoreductase [Symploca sp. SIO3C6]NER32054.1 NAD(P)/FAD-dependent oxidoreductase [Symploca sp. SIO1C4]
MTVDYDLIVIGGSTAAIYAAVKASRLKARVALVEPPDFQSNWLSQGVIYTQVLQQVGRAAKQRREADKFFRDSQVPESTTQFATDVPLHSSISVQVTQAKQWADVLLSHRLQKNSPEVLASSGVDVIVGVGEFCRRPHLGFTVNNRLLRGRAYLIATGSDPKIPQIEGLQEVGYLTPPDIWQQMKPQAGEGEEKNKANSNLEGFSSFPLKEKIPLGNKPNLNRRGENLEQLVASTHNLQGSWVVIGGSPLGTQLAQILARLGCDVTLVESGSGILPKEDPEASRLVQAKLEAEGVRLLTQSPVSHVRQIENKKWIQAGNEAIEADEILLACGHQSNLESLNLEGVGVKFHSRGLEINEKLQTTNRHIYACGDVIGGYQLTHVAEYEASIALKNALFAPLFKVDYHSIPWTISCDPQLARVGLTEAQARRRYGKKVWVVRQFFKNLEKAQLLGETTGFCKLVIGGNGEILGASIVGAEASELIGEIALAIRQKIKVGAIARLSHPSLTLSEIIVKTARECQQQGFDRHKTLQDFLEGFFNLRRNWSK